jgi:Winged helix DNA-binding domain
VRDWLGQPAPVDREQALAELARRYLRAHAPADDRDLARWAGLPLRDVRAGLTAIAAELHQREDGLLELELERGHRCEPAAFPPPLLLGAFDPLLLGWRSREELLADSQGIVLSNGLFRPIALVGGRAVATWALSRGEVALKPFARLTPKDRDELSVEADDVLRYLGLAA